MVPLDLMSPNDCGVIVEMDGDPCFLKRLEEIVVESISKELMHLRYADASAA